MRKPYKFYSLTRPRLRQSWNKYNLYNIARSTGAEPQVKGRATFFQQKWAAKSKTRGYHGEHIPEKKWVRLFSRRLLSAVDLPPDYLAANDGSEQAAGRGSGLSTSNLTAESYSRVPRPSKEKRRQVSHFSHRREGGFGDVNSMLSKQHENMTPYMQMTFAPLERRLDTAIFRAMFASSVRQARQFVIHGAVKVNGKKMVHPSYALNPGDMFQVDIEKVLYGTGEQKIGDPYASDKSAARAAKKRDDATIARYRQLQAEKSGIAPKEAAAEAEAVEAKETEGEEGAENEAAAVEENAWEDLEDEYKQKVQLSRLGNLRELARDVLEGDTRNLTAKQKKALRAFRDSVKRFLSLPEYKQMDARELVRELQLKIEDLSAKVPAFEKGVAEEDGVKEEETEEKEETDEQKKRREFKQRVMEKGLDGITDPAEIAWAKRIMKRTELSKDELRSLTSILRADLENPVDESKPYLTPWRPRPFMSAFAFIPRYLEVNPNICAAVYLRHPVARKGIAEVPTPFSYLTSQLAHNWYLQRG